MRFLLKRSGFYFIVYGKNYFGERNSGNGAELNNALPGPAPPGFERGVAANAI